MDGLTTLWRDFVGLLYPTVCQGCDQPLVKGEAVICLDCQIALPKTDFHEAPGNKMEAVFWGRVNIERAACCYYFDKGSKLQQLLHRLKYDAHPEVGTRLGQLYGSELKESDFAKGIDLIVPVPLHDKKLKSRGYNQSATFAEGLAQSLHVDWTEDALVRNIFTATQTKKTRKERWENVAEAFEVFDPDLLAGKHILLVDDVVTTGATMEACAARILAVPGTRLSIATIAMAQ